MKSNIFKRLIVGCMTGTSLDGLDCALVEIDGHGLSMVVSLLQTNTVPLGNLGSKLHQLCDQTPLTSRQITALSAEFSKLHLEAIRELIIDRSIDLIALHGQTVFHSPPHTWQLINPSIVAHNLNIPVVFDLRSADVVLGGQGAPITPLSDFILFRSKIEHRIIVNLGGFCNITGLPAGPENSDNNLQSWTNLVIGKDVCACNQILNRLSHILLGQPYDYNGSTAMTGKFMYNAFEALYHNLTTQSTSGRSLGTGDELSEWLSSVGRDISNSDMMRTACAAIAQVISNSIKSWFEMQPKDAPQKVIIAGGGAYNLCLMEEIRLRSHINCIVSDELGMPATHREATAMAVLGALCQDRVPITLAQITGVSNPPISGCWVLP